MYKALLRLCIGLFCGYAYGFLVAMYKALLQTLCLFVVPVVTVYIEPFLPRSVSLRPSASAMRISGSFAAIYGALLRLCVGLFCGNCITVSLPSATGLYH